MPKQRNGLLLRSCRGQRTGHRHTRVPQELGTPVRRHLFKDWLSRGCQTRKPLAPSRRRTWMERRTQAQGWSPSREGNEGRRVGRTGIGALHSTIEAGELVPREAGGGKGVPCRGTLLGQQCGGIGPRSTVHETTMGSTAHARPRPDEPDALIAHVRICGSPGR